STVVAFQMGELKRYVLAVFLAVFAAGSGGCTKQARANRYIAQAGRDFAAEQYDRAEIEYLNALKVVPLTPTAVSKLGVIYFIEGKLTRALAYLQKAVELEPENCEVRLKLAQTCRAFHKMKQARDEAVRILEKRPCDSDAWLLLVDSATSPKELE